MYIGRLSTDLVVVFHVDVTVVRADPSTGMVTSQDIMDALRPNTILVSVMLANNETGIIQPLGDIVKAVRRCVCVCLSVCVTCILEEDATRKLWG